MARTYHIYDPYRRRSLSVRLRLVPPGDDPERELPAREHVVPTLQLVASPPSEAIAAPVTPLAVPIATLPTAIEDAILTVLTAGPLPGETTSVAFQRKERELGARFAALTVVQSMDLHDRLSNPDDRDALARQFQRLVAERRARLLTFLADARRREAIASVRAGVA